MYSLRRCRGCRGPGEGLVSEVSKKKRVTYLCIAPPLFSHLCVFTHSHGPIGPMSCVFGFMSCLKPVLRVRRKGMHMWKGGRERLSLH